MRNSQQLDIQHLLMICDDVEARPFHRLTNRAVLLGLCDATAPHPAIEVELGCRLLIHHRTEFFQRKYCSQRRFVIDGNEFVLGSNLTPQTILEKTVRHLFEDTKMGKVCSEEGFPHFALKAIWRAKKREFRDRAINPEMLPKADDRTFGVKGDWKDLADIPDTKASPLSNAQAQEIRTIFEALPDEPRECLREYLFERKSLARIARERGLPRERVKQLIGQWQARLCSRLKAYGPAAMAMVLLAHEKAHAQAVLSAVPTVSGTTAAQGLSTAGTSGSVAIPAAKSVAMFTAWKATSVAVIAAITAGLAWYFTSLPQVNAVEEAVLAEAVVNHPLPEPEPLITKDDELVIAPKTDELVPKTDEIQITSTTDEDVIDPKNTDVAAEMVSEVQNDADSDDSTPEVLPNVPPQESANGTPFILRSEYLGIEMTFNKCGELFVLQTEVTNKHWDVVGADGRLPPNPSDFHGDDVPVANVTPKDTSKFCTVFNNITGYRVRLLTEEEWNHAAIADVELPARYLSAPNRNPTAREVEKFAWFSGNSGNRLHAVGGWKPNAWGLFDTRGNAAELVVTSSGGYRFMGGWYCADAFWCKPSYYGTWTKRENGVGFRICFKP